MTDKITKFEDLICWQKSRELVNLVFEICESGRLNKDYSTQHQIKRAAVSIMNNIAEGFGRHSEKEFLRFLEYSSASSMEVRSMLYILLDRQYIDEYKFKMMYDLSINQSNLTLGLIRYLNKRAINRTTDKTSTLST